MLKARSLNRFRRLHSAPCALALLTFVVALVALVPGAQASEAPTVSVRVEGLTETRLPATPTTLLGAPVVKDGKAEDSCPIGSALGALELASNGSWGGPWSSTFHQYSIATILGETHEFDEASKANYFWSFWQNDRESQVGACEATLDPGDRVLFFPSCFGEECPKPTPLPLEAEAPTSANVGEAIRVRVQKFSATGAAGEVAGASVVGGGAGGLTDAHGYATLTFARPGQVALQVDAPAAIRTEASVCVHNGLDGTCGAGLGTKARPPAPVGPAVAEIAGIAGGRVFARRFAPRLLRGVVHVPAGATLKDVRISLQRRLGRRCSTFSGARGRFVRSPCGKASFFSVGNSLSFSYLLPTRLPAGRYVYDIAAIDSSAAASTAAGAASHVVFRVR